MGKIQNGFTFVELVASLVLLGILAAVAIPKYISLQNDAEVKAALAAKSEAQARVYQLFYASLLTPNPRVTETSRCWAAWSEALQGYMIDFMTSSLGDWEVFFDHADANHCLPVYSISLGPKGHRHQVDLSGEDLTKAPWLLCAPRCD